MMVVRKPTFWVFYMVHFITTFANPNTILTTLYGHSEGTQYEAFDQGRIYTINEWGTDHVIGLQIIQWKSDSQTKFDSYGTGTIDESCLSFNLSQSNDYIIGYKIYVDEVIYYIDEEDEGEDEQVPVLRNVIRGLEFYTKNGVTYGCVEDDNVKNVYTNTYNNDYDFYYLSGWRIYSQRTINSIQFQFTKSSVSQYSPPTLNPTIFVTTQYETTQYNDENEPIEETKVSSTDDFEKKSVDFESTTPNATGAFDEDGVDSPDIQSAEIVYTTDWISQNEESGDDSILTTHDDSIDEAEENEENGDDSILTTDSPLIDSDEENEETENEDKKDPTSTTTTTAEEIKPIETRIVHVYINRTQIIRITGDNLEEIGIHDVFGGLPGTITIICMMILLCCTIAICFGLTIFVCKRCINEHKDQESVSLTSEIHDHAIQPDIVIPMPKNNNPVLTIPTKHRNGEKHLKTEEKDGGLPITVLKIATSKSPHIRNNALDMSSIVNGSPSVPYTGEDDINTGEEETDSETMYSTNNKFNDRRDSGSGSTLTTAETPQITRISLVSPPIPEIDGGEQHNEDDDEEEEEDDMMVYDEYEFEIEDNLQPMPSQNELGLLAIRSNTAHVD